jgi:hypothetical protein
MNDIIYFSLYSDIDFKSMKHSLLYFDKLIIPSNEYILDATEEKLGFHFIQMTPHETNPEAYNHLAYLCTYGLIEFKKLDDNIFGNNTKHSCYDIILNGTNAAKDERIYNKNTILEICDFLKIKPQALKNNNISKLITQTSILLAAACFSEYGVNGKICLIDNQLIYDNILYGFSEILSKIKNYTEKDLIDIKKLKENLLAKKIFSLYLPAFDYLTFDDIIDIKNKHKDELLSFQDHMTELSLKINKTEDDADFHNNIDNYIQNKVRPKIDDFIKSIKLSPSKIIKKTLLNSATFILTQNYSSITQQDIIKHYINFGATGLIEIYNESKRINKTSEASPYNIIAKLQYFK